MTAVTTRRTPSSKLLTVMSPRCRSRARELELGSNVTEVSAMSFWRVSPPAIAGLAHCGGSSDHYLGGRRAMADVSFFKVSRAISPVGIWEVPDPPDSSAGLAMLLWIRLIRR